MNLTILDSVDALIKRVKQETGKPVLLVQAEEMPGMVETRPAGASDTEHIIYISKAFKDPEGQYLIACKCYQILRIFREKEEERLIPSSGKSHFNNARMRLALDVQGRPDLARALNEEEIVRAWIYGVVNQLISQPADIYIQKALYEEQPELNQTRLMVLERQFQDFMSAQKEEVRHYSPKTVYDASLIMNSVYLSLLDEVAGMDFLSRVGVLPQSRKIARLLTATKEISEDTPAADRARTDLWADFLSLRDWYEWLPSERDDPIVHTRQAAK
ncbi:hypothetical protein [Oceanispirochaeta sp.]|jgi:hypothetical protein|uniref:hypothetical protein n=1 Tax=Oceanispirochaeta sp. TaxID=2035350 RepID=UPI0026183363|nr:hypothetical protein [Oceanispirochaeta sp.]MDA3956157.1 hypothetical protein [Oceanispirochaeta sp.]